MSVDHAWWHLTMLDDAKWNLVDFKMLDDSWWFLMMLDNAWWCLMNLILELLFWLKSLCAFYDKCRIRNSLITYLNRGPSSSYMMLGVLINGNVIVFWVDTEYEPSAFEWGIQCCQISYDYKLLTDQIPCIQVQVLRTILH